MKLVDFLESENIDKTIIKEKVEIPDDKHRLTLVNILLEMDEKKKQRLIKKKL